MDRSGRWECDPAKLETGLKNGARLRLLAWLVAGLALWAGIYFALQPAAEYLSYDILKLSPSSRLGSSVAFFVYDAPKVLLLLVIAIAAGVVQFIVNALSQEEGGCC